LPLKHTIVGMLRAGTLADASQSPQPASPSGLQKEMPIG
jgi:hypothetical protein